MERKRRGTHAKAWVAPIERGLGMSSKKRVYYYDQDNLKVRSGTARYRFCLRYAKDRAVVDIGCGARRGPHMLAHEAQRVVGLDASPDAVSYSAKTWPAECLFYMVSDGVHLALRDDFFDLAVSFEVIEHIGDYQRYLFEVRRVLKRDGVFVVSTPNRPVASPGGVLSNPDHVREFSYDEFRSVLSPYFSDIVFYGQFPSDRLLKLEEAQRRSYEEASCVPGFVKKILPPACKDFLLNFYGRLVCRRAVGIDAAAIGDDDFTFDTKNAERGRYLLAVCKKSY